jgi:hypothetical protein
VDLLRDHQGNSGVAVLFVVPIEKRLTEILGILN